MYIIIYIALEFVSLVDCKNVSLHSYTILRYNNTFVRSIHLATISTIVVICYMLVI